MIRNVKSHSDMVSLWCEFFCYLWGHLSFHGKHIWQCSHWYGFSLVWVLMWFFFKTLFCNAHTDMVSLWYEFLCDSFSKPFSAMLTLIWFLFGMSSYAILLQNVFHNTHIEIFLSFFFFFWYGFLCVENRININLYGMIKVAAMRIFYAAGLRK